MLTEQPKIGYALTGTKMISSDVSMSSEIDHSCSGLSTSIYKTDHQELSTKTQWTTIFSINSHVNSFNVKLLKCPSKSKAVKLQATLQSVSIKSLK